MIKWEHKIVRISGMHSQVENDLDAYGAQGWELAAVVHGEDFVRICYFKRPLVELNASGAEFVIDSLPIPVPVKAAVAAAGGNKKS